MAASHIALKGSDRAARSKRVSSHTFLDYVIAAELTRVKKELHDGKTETRINHLLFKSLNLNLEDQRQ
jgi:hypothetical protein